MSLREQSEKEKRKWQIALRRYVVGQQPSPAYAPYFALDIARFREWIELQFRPADSWASFGKTWQLDQIIPVAFFDLTMESDLRLCWSFLNIRAESINPAEIAPLDLLHAKKYFTTLHRETENPVAADLLHKISVIEGRHQPGTGLLTAFLLSNQGYLTFMASRDAYAFHQLNSGTPFEALKTEIELLEKFG